MRWALNPKMVKITPVLRYSYRGSVQHTYCESISRAPASLNLASGQNSYVCVSGKFDGFVLVSSDSDFTALANRLREDGRTVIGIGESKTPDSLRNVCNRFILIENLIETPAAKTKTPAAAQALKFFRDAIAKSDQDDEWYHLGGIGSTIQAAHPDFDTRTYGHAKLSSLVKAIPQIETKQNGTHLMIRLKP